MPELAPPPSPVVRRGARLEQVRRREEQISVLIAQQRLEVAALAREDLAGLSARYVPDELAMLLRLSPRQARNRVDGAQAFADFPAVHALVGDGTWLIAHADAALDELTGSGLDHAQQQQVLELVLARPVGRTPWELRQAVRTACVVLFPDLALARSEKARADRDVRCYPDAPGAASLLATGPAAAVAAMMACLDTMTTPAAPGDPRTAAQRRFDTLTDLVCGRLQPGSWQAHLLVALSTVEGHDELPGEMPGLGPIPAPLARQIVAGATLRRVIVDEHTGQLIAVDDRVHRPDLPPPAPDLLPLEPPDDPDDEPDGRPDDPDDDPPGPPPPDDSGTSATSDVEPEPPSDEDLDWIEEHTDRTTLYADPDAPVATCGREPATAAASPATTPAHPPYPAPCWSPQALTTALHRIRTDPVRTPDLSSGRYPVPPRLKRFLELRDRTCVFPGCPRPAPRCDKDHLLPWPRGSTSEPNLADECEHHHQGKHDRLTVHRLPDGTFRWTTPAGITADRPPRPVLDSWTYRGTGGSARQ